mmetsp:Transcript_70084/g.105966  ORF Transcript_70084/g.105966 Transcript_70084/m.105966 type:complete len:159 (-) Transcript_70084:107-583(-)
MEVQFFGLCQCVALMTTSIDFVLGLYRTNVTDKYVVSVGGSGEKRYHGPCQRPVASTKGSKASWSLRIGSPPIHAAGQASKMRMERMAIKKRLVTNTTYLALLLLFLVVLLFLLVVVISSDGWCSADKDDNEGTLFGSVSGNSMTANALVRFRVGCVV